MEPETYLNIRQAAELLRVHPNTIRNWLRQGELPGKQIGRLWRISAAAVESLIAGTQTEREEDHD